MKSRLHLPTPDEMTPEQAAVHDDVLRTRGNAAGPFLAWLLSPGLAGPAQQLGAFCRYRTSLSLQESELLILMVAAHYQCIGEQQIHEPIALQAGLGDTVISAVREGRRPALSTARLDTLYEIASELLATRRLVDTCYQRHVAALGETALVEVVGVIGYYAFVAYTLNAFDMRVR